MSGGNTKPSSLMGVARGQVSAWVKGCSAATQKRLSDHELLALRQMVVACMEISRERTELT